jgi:hypothetical protein
MAPVVGPVIAAVGSNSSAGGTWIALGVFDALLQAGGLTMVIIGIAAPRQELVFYGDADSPAHRSRPQWALLPMAPGATAGLSLNVTNF